MGTLRKIISTSLATALLIAAAPLTSYAAITPEIVDNGQTAGSSTFTGTFTTVTTTMGSSGAYYPTGTSPIYFSTDASGANYSNAFVQWTFTAPVTKVRVYYAYVESVLYADNSGANDPQSWTTNLGDVDLALTTAGGNRESSAGEAVAGQLEASLAGNVANCAAPNVTCSGYIDLSFPQGISWIKTENAAGGGGPGFNGVGLALDAGEQGVAEVDTPLANTGSDLGLLAIAATLVSVGAVLANIRFRGRKKA